MGLQRCLFGCLLALTGVGTAAAMDGATQDPVAPHATIDNGSRDGGGGSGDAGDSASSSRDCTLPGSAGGTDASDGGGSGGTAAPSRASHHSSLGWQSLLPGSIQ